MTHKIAISIALFALAIGAIIVYSWRQDAQNRENAVKVHRLCAGAKEAMRQDAITFESGDAAEREEAYQRFYYGQAMYHSAQSLLYCVDTLPEMPLGCQLNKDWACLAKLAWTIHRSLP